MKLQLCIQQYAEDKRSTGARFDKGNRTLASFLSHVGDVSLDEIHSQHVVAFLDLPNTSDIAWVRRYNLLRAFFLFWAAREIIRSLPMPQPRRAAKRNFVPYIYSQGEVRRLLQRTRASQAYSGCCIDMRTLRAFLLFLYGTGAMVSEGVRLLREDVDFKRRLVTIRNGRFEPSRTIPIGSDVYGFLRSYDSPHQQDRRKNRPFFLDKSGESLKANTLNATFLRLRNLAGIARNDGVAQAPRMYDLRYTFAVHRLTAWHKHGADLNRMIPALSVYMGYGHLGGAARFLTLTPERFRGQLNKLSPRQAKRRWRDDAALMQFLSTL